MCIHGHVLKHRKGHSCARSHTTSHRTTSSVLCLLRLQIPPSLPQCSRTPWWEVGWTSPALETLAILWFSFSFHFIIVLFLLLFAVPGVWVGGDFFFLALSYEFLTSKKCFAIVLSQSINESKKYFAFFQCKTMWNLAIILECLS